MTRAKLCQLLPAAGLVTLLLTGCSSEAVPEKEVADAAAARDAALEYLREHDPGKAPGAGIQWQSEDATPEGLVGQAATVFTSDGLTARVSSPVVAPEHITYSVIITSVPGAWRWEANVKRDGSVTEVSPLTTMSEQNSRKTAEDFVRNSPTFSYDGMEDTLQLVHTLTARCPFCWVFVFDFTSRHAGYGDRTGMMLAQVLTPHRAVVTVEQGEVVSAIMDERWDMVRQEETD